MCRTWQECSWDKHRDGLLCDHSIPKRWLVDAGRFFPQLQWIWCYGDSWSSFWPTRSCMAKFAAVGQNFIERYSYREVEQLTINCNYSTNAILYDIIWPLQGTQWKTFHFSQTFELVRHCSQVPWSQNFSFLPFQWVSCATSITDHLYNTEGTADEQNRSKEQLAQLAASSVARSINLARSVSSALGSRASMKGYSMVLLNLLDLCSLQQFFQTERITGIWHWIWY